MKSARKLQAMLAMSAVALSTVGGVHVAGAQAAATPKASAFAVKADVLGNNVIPPTPEVTRDGVGDDSDNTLIGIPGDPLIVNGTLIAKSAVHNTSDLKTELTLAAPPVHPGSYPARAIGQIEDLSVLLNKGIPSGVLLSADVLRAEAVVDCSSGSPVYKADSEVVDLRIGGDTSFNGPLNMLVAEIAKGIHGSPLKDLVDIELNKVTPLDGGGAAVDALVVTVLRPAEDNGADGPVAQITLGHAQVSGNPCAGGLPKTDLPECSDTQDNADPEDVLADKADPGCHSDGNPLNDATYDPNDDDETNVPNVLGGGALPKTGAAIPMGIAAGLGIGALSLLALRRRLTAV